MSELIPVGTYKARAIQVDGAYAQLGYSQGGNQQVLVQFELMEGPDTGRRVPWWGSFTDKAWQRTIEALRYCGFKGDELFTLPEQSLDQEVSIVIEHSEYNGKTNARVRWVNAAASGIKLAKPMAANDLRNFSAMMKSRAASVKAVDGPKAAAPTASRGDESAPHPSDDNDPPF